MKLIDTHSHIYHEKYNKDLDEVINRAIDNEVDKIICVGVDIPSSLEAIEVANKYDIVYATVGFHPHEAKYANKPYLYELENLLTNDKVVAIGEIGLDYHYNYSDKRTQKKIFIEQLELSQSLDMPVIIHNRNSDNDLIKCIEKKRPNKGVVHCFASNINFANKLISLNIHLSFTGLITFVQELEYVIQNIELENIMLETDSPYLTPVPNRGKRNEPAMVKYVAKKISELKKIAIEEVATVTTKTANDFFGL